MNVTAPVSFLALLIWIAPAFYFLNKQDIESRGIWIFLSLVTGPLAFIFYLLVSRSNDVKSLL